MIKSLRTRAILPAIAFLAALLTACGSAPPAPSDRFYRLQAELQRPTQAVTVRSVRADSLYAERAIVFVREDDPRQLRQYHYHLWLYPPAQTVQEHLRTGFGSVPTGDASFSLDARVTHFERVLDGRNSRALAGLAVTIADARGAVSEKRYRAEVAATDDSYSSFAMAMEKALGNIYRELGTDIDTLVQPRR